MFLASYIYYDICQNVSQRLIWDDTKIEHENFSGVWKMKEKFVTMEAGTVSTVGIYHIFPTFSGK